MTWKFLSRQRFCPKKAATGTVKILSWTQINWNCCIISYHKTMMQTNHLKTTFEWPEVVSEVSFPWFCRVLCVEKLSLLIFILIGFWAIATYKMYKVPKKTEFSENFSLYLLSSRPTTTMNLEFSNVRFRILASPNIFLRSRDVIYLFRTLDPHPPPPPPFRTKS